MNLCIVAHFAYGAFSGGAIGHVGGVERQTSLMAKWFAARGHQVSLLTWDEGQPANCIIDGVRVIKMCRQTAGVPGIRFFHPRWSSLNQALAKADADIYYQNCGEYITGQVAWWCRKKHRLFTYSTANDTDCDPALPAMRTVRERILYKYGLLHADGIIAQTKKQQQMLSKGFHLSSTVLPMPCPGPDETKYQQPVYPDKTPLRIGWAARFSQEKRLELLVEVARTLPEVIFEVGGATTGKASDEYATPILAAAALLPNIILHGRIARKDMPAFYNKLHLFCCTSAYEGFPNTFIEAWSHGLPIVSTFDPDNLITEHGLGKAATDAASLVKGIRFFMENPKEWEAASLRARKYFLHNHMVDEVMARFEQVFMEVLKKGKKSES
jgi:glycosyltransferase involved in cell wall biosynthesis